MITFKIVFLLHKLLLLFGEDVVGADVDIDVSVNGSISFGGVILISLIFDENKLFSTFGGGSEPSIITSGIITFISGGSTFGIVTSIFGDNGNGKFFSSSLNGLLNGSQVIWSNDLLYE